MPPKPPACPDCGVRDAKRIIWGLPDRELGEAEKRGEVVLGGCLVDDNMPAWECRPCTARYGDWQSPNKAPRARTKEEWMPLIRTMLPQPVEQRGTELWGGEPATVVVTVTNDQIEIRTATLEWPSSSEPHRSSAPFCKRPLRTPAQKIAHMIQLACGKRVSEYVWCVRCQKTMEPEHLFNESTCHGCASKDFGVVF